MNTKKGMKSLVLSLAVVFASGAVPLLASEGGHHEGAGEVMHMPETVPGLWHEIKEQEELLAKTINAGSLGDVHKIAFTIRDLSKTLAEKSTDLAPDAISKVKSSVERVAEVAALLDQYGDAGDKTNTEDQFARLGKLLQFIEMQYPPDALSLGGKPHSHEEGGAHHAEGHGKEG